MPVYARARDAQVILLVEALDDSREEIWPEGGPNVEKTVVRVIDAVKGDTSLVNGRLEIITFGREVDGAQRIKPVLLQRGKRYYLFSDAPDPTVPDSLWSRRHPIGHFRSCEVEMMTPQSETEIRRGMKLNDSLRGDEPSVSLEGFARRKRRLFDQ